MKLNYRDKIILAVLLAVIICVGGYLLLIKKKSQEIKNNESTLSEVQQRKEDAENKIAKIPNLQTRIKETYAKADSYTEIFVPKSEIENPVKLDEKLQKYADDNNVRIYSLEVANPKVTKIGYYYFNNEDTDKELRNSVDINGDLQAQYENKYQDSIALSQRTAENVLRTQYGVKIRGEKEDIWNYLKAIEEIDNAVIIDSVNILDYTFGMEAILNASGKITEVVAPTEPEQGEEENTEELPEIDAPATNVVVTEDGTELDYKSDVQIVISLYSIYKMPEPDVETIPDAE